MTSDEVLRREVLAAMSKLERVLAILDERASEDVSIEAAGSAPPFTYRWPAGPERYPRPSAWRVREPFEAELLVGETHRSVWGRKRRRTVVFGPHDPRSRRPYPWVEFVETDDGRMSAIAPDPARPRRVLRDGEALPAHYADFEVERADRLFGSIKDGASLRVIAVNEEEMVRHAIYAAGLKGRI